MPDISVVREKIGYYLDDSESGIGKIIDLVLLAVNLLACAVFVIGSYYSEKSYPVWLLVVDLFIVTVFIIEYVLRIWTARHTFRYIISFYGLVDLISILPSLFLIPELSFLRAFKVLRILRFFRFLETEKFFFGTISRLQLQVARTFFTAFTILFLASGFILAAESGAPDASIKTFDEAFYFCVITLSTVGYGDYVTITPAGRWITLIMILGGAIFVPWQIGKLVRLLIIGDAGKRNITCPKCGLVGHDFDASHCKACGAVIYQEYHGDV